MCSQSQAIAILGEVYAACDLIFGNAMRDAYLYGSYARGDYHKESDIDILLTVDMEQDVIADYYSDVGIVSSDLSLKHDITISVTVKALSQFMQYSNILPYYKNVLQEGLRYGD